MLRIETTSFKHQVCLELAGNPLFLIPYQFAADGRTVFAAEIAADGDSVHARFSGDTHIRDHFTFEPGCITVRRSWTLSGSFGAGLVFSVMRRASPTLWIMPGAAYRTLPQGTEYSASMYESACTVPSMLFLQDESLYMAVFTDPAAGASDISSVSGHISSMYAETRIAVPGGAAPHAPDGRTARELSVQGLLSYERTFYILYGEPGHGALAHALGRARDRLSFDAEPPHDWSAPVAARVSGLCHYFFLERGDAAGFVARLTPGMFPLKPVFKGGGPGGGIAAVRALYHASRAVEDLPLKKCMLDTADFFLEGFEAHEHRCTDYHLGARHWLLPQPGPGHNAALGAMLYEYLLLHHATRPARDHNPRWIRACRQWADSFIHQLKPHIEDPLDAVQKQDQGASPGQGGLDASAAWYALVLAALALRHPGSGYGRLAARLCEALMPLCTEAAWCGPNGPPHRDTALAAMRAFRRVHAATGQGHFLDAAESMAGLLLSYTWAAAARLPADSAAGRADLRLAGAVNPDPARPRMDTGAADTALELLRLDALLGGGSAWRRAALSQLEFTAALVSAPVAGALSPWPGCDPAGVSLGGRPGPLTPVAMTRMLTAAMDISMEFPDVIHITFQPRTMEKTIKSTLGRTVLAAGCALNRWAR